MSHFLPLIYLARHGETEWSATGQHTSFTDLPLTERGEHDARLLGRRLAELTIATVFVSPLVRARRTCELAGLADVAKVEPDLVEWNYGMYEGKRTAEIRELQPDWQLFRDGCPYGEKPEQVGARADRVIAKARQVEGNVLLISSGHISRVLAARWLGLPPWVGKYFQLSTVGLSALGYDHDLSEPVLRLWNDTAHLAESVAPMHSKPIAS